MILKERQIKKKHHYVWDHYIRRWSNDDKNVWHTTSKGNISYNSTKGLAREDHCYISKYKHLFNYYSGNFYQSFAIKNASLSIPSLSMRRYNFFLGMHSKSAAS